MYYSVSRLNVASTILLEQDYITGMCNLGVIARSIKTRTEGRNLA